MTTIYAEDVTGPESVAELLDALGMADGAATVRWSVPHVVGVLAELDEARAALEAKEKELEWVYSSLCKRCKAKVDDTGSGT